MYLDSARFHVDLSTVSLCSSVSYFLKWTRSSRIDIVSARSFSPWRHNLIVGLCRFLSSGTLILLRFRIELFTTLRYVWSRPQMRVSTNVRAGPTCKTAVHDVNDAAWNCEFEYRQVVFGYRQKRYVSVRTNRTYVKMYKSMRCGASVNLL